MLKDYVELVEKVRKIDKEAALFMEDEVTSFDNVDFTSSLGSAFTWSETPQGHRYWENLRNKLCTTPEKEAFKKLVEKVREIDREPAYWLENEAPKLKEFMYTGNLVTCFDWHDSPQGSDYWSLVNRMIKGDI